MTVPALLTILFTGLMSLLVSWCLLVPFFSQQQERTGEDAFPEHIRLRELLLQKERLLRALEDLEVDHVSGRVSDEDFRSLKEALVKETANCLEELDESK